MKRRPVTFRTPQVGDVIYVDDVITGLKRSFPNDYMLMQRDVPSYFFNAYEDKRHLRTQTESFMLDLTTGDMVRVDTHQLSYFSIEE